MNNYFEIENEKYLISTDPLLMQVEIVHNYLSQQSYWAKNIPLHTVEMAIKNSLCFGVYINQKQIGFARLITDKATFAYLADVFILEEYRGKGLSKYLMKCIHEHPELQDLRRWVLGTKDAHSLYEKFGWVKFSEEQLHRFMHLHNPDVYEER